MSGGPQIARFARQELDRHGVDATLTLFSATGSADTYGDTQWASSTQSIKSVFETRDSVARIAVSIGGEERTVEADAWIKDTISVPVDPARAPQFDHGGVTYEVLQARDEKAGHIHLHLERIR